MTNNEKLKEIEEKHGKKALLKVACDAALINVHKIKKYCSDDNYNLIVDTLKNPHKLNDAEVRNAVYTARATVWSFVCDSSCAACAAESAWSAFVYAFSASVYAAVVHAGYAVDAVKYAIDAGATQDQIDDILTSKEF